MRTHLVRPSAEKETEFLQAARRSRKLHETFVSPPSTSEEYRRYLRGTRRPRQESFFVMGLESKAIAGVVNLTEIVRGEFQSAYLGYYSFVPYAGSGFMREGLWQAISYAFRELRLHRLEANIQPQNRRSISLVRSLRFRKEGFSPGYLRVCGSWRDHERWAIRSDEWKPHEVA